MVIMKRNVFRIDVVPLWVSPATLLAGPEVRLNNSSPGIKLTGRYVMLLIKHTEASITDSVVRLAQRIPADDVNNEAA